MNHVFLLPEGWVSSKKFFNFYSQLSVLTKQSMCKQHGELSDMDISPKVNKKEYCVKVNIG